MVTITMVTITMVTMVTISHNLTLRSTIWCKMQLPCVTIMVTIVTMCYHGYHMCYHVVTIVTMCSCGYHSYHVITIVTICYHGYQSYPQILLQQYGVEAKLKELIRHEKPHLVYHSCRALIYLGHIDLPYYIFDYPQVRHTIHNHHTDTTQTPHRHHTDTTQTLGFDRIFGSVRFGSAIRLFSAGSVRFGFGSDYPNINRTSRARMSISNAPRVTKKS